MNRSFIVLTVFTPSYNRGHLLDRLYASLQRQSITCFEWIIIDDGSTDNTANIVQQWQKEYTQFPIRYIKKENGGKARAINDGVKLAQGKYFFIVDSDDYLADDALESLIKWFSELPESTNFIGVSGVKQDINNNRNNIKIPVNSYIDDYNINRTKYGLEADMAEAFFTEKLRQYNFPVWPNEKFIPESVVWDQMALDGYILRWYNKVIYYCEYLEGGLTQSSWKLLKNNPMGYAQMFLKKLAYIDNPKLRINYILQFISCCCLAHEYRYILRCQDKKVFFLLPIGFMLSIRRRLQFKSYLR